MVKRSGKGLSSLLTALPASFMSAVSLTYILMAKEGFRLGSGISCPVGAVFAVALFVLYLVLMKKHRSSSLDS